MDLRVFPPRTALHLLAVAALILGAPRGVAGQQEEYVTETDPAVVAKLDRWQDLKLGLLMHWGTYSQWGIVESWSLCSEDEDWCRRPKDSEYGEYKKAYENLQTTFNPVKFDPERWAQAARDAGMRYMVFTTKHHDGFSMFDTKETDYRITSPKTPFSSDPRADVTREIFDAFRAQGFMVGAYFSKPDWHSPDFWWPYFATPDRYPNYDVSAYPERWQRFVDFTHAQIHELMANYGPMDILWLDGGWVRTRTEKQLAEFRSRPGFHKQRVQSLDIDMPGIVRDARALQPGLIVVNRAVPGRYQDYLTPEARVPDEPIADPWEVPMPMATSWSYVPDDPYKSPRELVHMLEDVVAKGGNLLLNIGPGPDGTWHDDAYDRLQALGDWMRINGDAIYGTRAMEPWGTGKLRYTQGKDGTLYALYLADEGETTLPRVVSLPGLHASGDVTVRLLGSDARLTTRATADGVDVQVPPGTASPSPWSWVLAVSGAPGEAHGGR